MIRLFSFLALTAVSTPAFAHAGSHEHLTGWAAAVQHLVSSPFHGAMLLAGAACAAFVLSKLQKGVRKASRR